MGNLNQFFRDLGRNAYGLGENVASLGSAAIAEPVAGFAAMYDPANGAAAIREGMTYTPRSQAGQMYQQGAARTLGAIAKPAMPVIDTWQRGVDIAGGYSPAAGAMLRTVPAAIGVAMGAKPALQAGRQVSNSLGAMQARMIANANAPRILNTGYMGQRGAIGTLSTDDDLRALARFNQMDDVYKFDNSHEYYDPIDRLVSRNLGDDAFDFMELPTSYGKITITPSAKEQGKWQVTQWAKDGYPLSDSGNQTKEKALRTFFEDSKPELLPSPKRPLTEFEQVHLLAQQRAALPVNQMGLDLPANNTAMDRARAMGWADDGYHGTSSDFPEFSLGGYGVHGNVGGTGVYLGVPDMASSYAQSASSLTGKPANVMPLLTRGKLLDTNSEAPLNNNLIDKYINENLSDGDKARIALDAGGKRTTRTFENIEDAKDFFWNQKKNWEAFGGFDRTLPQADMIDGKAVVSYVDFNAPVSLNGLPTKEVHEALRRAGGGTMTDVLKNIGYDGTKSARETVIFDPKNIRSRFAAFDPFNRNSSNLLAQSAKLAPAATLGALMANEKRKDKRN